MSISMDVNDVSAQSGREAPDELREAGALDALFAKIDAGEVQLTGKGVKISFIKEGLSFTGDDSPMATLLLSVMGAFAEFERALIRERQREGIALAKARGVYRGRKPVLTRDQARELARRAASGDSMAGLAREFGISRETAYAYLRSIGR
jgi:DNA invertase Pin-like site-specific DNA recombinase